MAPLSLSRPECNFYHGVDGCNPAVALFSGELAKSLAAMSAIRPGSM